MLVARLCPRCRCIDSAAAIHGAFGRKVEGPLEAQHATVMATPAPKPKLKLYAADWCWYCRRVVEKLDALSLDYEYVEVPVFHSKRTDVLAVSGQTSVPVLVDGGTVLDDDDVIIPYLDERYGSGK